MTDADAESGPRTKQSSSRDFGRCVAGYAVEFNIAGYACRSLTVESRQEAEIIQNSIKSKEGTSSVEVVRNEVR